MRARIFILLLCLLWSGIAQAGVRRSIFALDPNGPEIASLRKGIHEMKRRSDSNPGDPTGWNYQANIHSTTDSGALALWNTCQHGSFFFFSWHRMYLYYFERILRKASGDPNLTLPYWNYTDDPWMPDPDRRQLPLAFRQPAVECGSPPKSWDTTPNCNPLFVSQRRPHMNDGTGSLDRGAVDYSHAFNYTNFEAPAGSGFASFGGGEISQPMHSNMDWGALELTPHNVVHCLIGGWMCDTRYSAHDPIFFLHHANIDRLWNHWLAQGGGRQDPTSDQVWMNTIMFTFYDENGTPVQKSGKDILDSAGQLGYCYEDEPGCCPQCATQLCDNNCDNSLNGCFDRCPDAGDCPDSPPQAWRNCIKDVQACDMGCVKQERQCIASCK
jgi:Common central domain of tyrosinase/Polyphenol oxidase middle domain